MKVASVSGISTGADIFDSTMPSRTKSPRPASVRPTKHGESKRSDHGNGQRDKSPTKSHVRRRWHRHTHGGGSIAQVPVVQLLQYLDHCWAASRRAVEHALPRPLRPEGRSLR